MSYNVLFATAATLAVVAFSGCAGSRASPTIVPPSGSSDDAGGACAALKDLVVELGVREGWLYLCVDVSDGDVEKDVVYLDYMLKHRAALVRRIDAANQILIGGSYEEVVYALTLLHGARK